MDIESILRTKGHGTFIVPPETTIEETAHLMTDHNIGIVIVSDDQQQLAGVLSERDVIRAIARHGIETCSSAQVRSFMVTKVQTCAPTDHPHDVLVRMNDLSIRHMPVVDQGHLKGMISSRDIISYLAKHASPDQQAFMWAKLFSVGA